MSKYASLTHHLKEFGAPEWRASFHDIENVLGFRLPAAARRHRAWWSNNDSNNVMTTAWLEAGWRTEQVDMSGEALLFRRARKNDSTPSRSTSHSPRRSVIGRLKGTVVFLDESTGPTGEVWNAEEGRL